MTTKCNIDPVLQIIDRMDEIIYDEAHWGQGVWSGGNAGRPLSSVRNCPMTALSIAVHPPAPLFQQVREYLTRAVPPIAHIENDYPAKIGFYNNRPERTFAEIKQLIAKARGLRLADLAAH